jgi:hypothetical protein
MAPLVAWMELAAGDLENKADDADLFTFLSFRYMIWCSSNPDKTTDPQLGVEQKNFYSRWIAESLLLPVDTCSS